MTVDKSYIFAVAAKNSVGQSDFVETKPVSTRLQYGPPPTPVNVKATVNPEKAPMSQQSVELTWELSAETGAVPADVVTEFLVEMKPKDGTRWQEVAKELTEPHATLPTDTMKEFTDYEFRVTAKNKAGTSKPSAPSNAIQLGVPLEFVREVPKIVVTEAPSKDEPVILECELSRKPREQPKWLRNGKPLPSRLPKGVSVEEDKQSTIHRITFTELTEEDLGEYTLQVEKIASTGGVEMKEIDGYGLDAFAVAPSLRLSEKFEDTIILKAGASTVVEVPFVASPKPSI
ncbi:unnamed protein product, partial [Mesocestoides corti]